MSIPKCKAKDCPRDKEQCRRYTSPESGMRQIWVNPYITKTGICTEFVPDVEAVSRKT